MARFTYLLVIFLCAGEILGKRRGNRYCEGTYDPVCYFPDAAEAKDPYFLSLYAKHHTNINSILNNSIDEGPDVKRGQRKSSKKKGKKNRKKKKLNAVEQVTFIALTNKEISQATMKTYPSSDKPTEVSYPPFTYNGLYSPVTWHLIPKWYFLPRMEKKIGKYTGMLLNVKSGMSFMDFKSLYAKEIKERERAEKRNQTTEDRKPEKDMFDSFGGVSSINCAHALFPAPLDIITENAKEDVNCIEFKINNIDNVYAFIMYVPEDGTDLLFVKLQTPPKQISLKPSIEKGATIGNTLYLDRIMIHYGVTPGNGAEHRINGKSFGMELQFFFTAQRQGKSGERPYWTTLEDYIIDNDDTQYGRNLLVLCVLVEVGPNGEKNNSSHNKGMKYLAMGADAFVPPNNRKKYRAYATKNKVLRMSDFFQIPQTGLYYTYYGSLTHPPCFNNTRYAVFENPIYMSHEDWRKFLFIPSEFSDTGFVAGNFRNMDLMTYNRSSTQTVRYDVGAKKKLSHTVVRSRRVTDKERQAEYDYYEDITTTLKPKE